MGPFCKCQNTGWGPGNKATVHSCTSVSIQDHVCDRYKLLRRRFCMVLASVKVLMYDIQVVEYKIDTSE